MSIETNRYLTEDALELRSVVRRFVSEKMSRSDAAGWDKAAHFPRPVLDELAELGVMGL
ncbi:acyl-CoA dehydrogenase family protein, partial [Frankia sp. AvcI1]